MLLQMEQITKTYGSLTANQGIDFTLAEGEIHALVGENGAGKTTLMRMLYGMEQPTSGVIRVQGEEVRFASPADAIRSGIGMVHQHFMLFPSFTVAENIVVGSEPAAGPLFNRKKAITIAQELSSRYGMPIDPSRKVADCPVGIQQRVEILKVLYQGARLIILDEPTGALTPLEVKELLASIKQLSRQGKSFILITHKLQEVMEVADRITVLRDGRVTGAVRTEHTGVEELSRLMVGRELAAVSKSAYTPGETVLQARGLTIRGSKGKPLLDDVSLEVKAGEIVGLAGIAGNGQSELIHSLAGLQPLDRGTVTLLGKEMAGASVNRIREQGLAYIPEDRYMWGAAKDATVLENGLMGHQRRLAKAGLLRGRSIQQLVREWVERFAIKSGGLKARSKHMSGGNMQKLIVARELAQQTPFLIAAEPTRGVDIGAMETIHQQLLAKRASGGAILLVSSELTEIMKLSDRILVMYEGTVAGELSAAEATEERISLLMAGGNAHV